MTRWLGHPLVELDSVGSTNDEAMARARAGATHGTVVTAREQTRGRGRQGRSWHSPPGDNLYLSMVLRLALPPAAAPPITLAIGVAVCDAVSGLAPRASIKWPNDVLLDGKKVAGILTESSTRGERLEAVVVGVGINVATAQFPPDLAERATSLRLAGAVVSLADVRDALLGHAETWIDRFTAEGVAPIARAWRARTRDLGRRVRIAVDGALVEGVVRELDDDGALILEDDAGRRVRVASGELAHVEPGGAT